jgi:hypothetical protein
MREIPCCFECWPGGPVTPPPCRKCGSTTDYYTSGLCARCHTHAPGARSPVWRATVPLGSRPVVDSCPDCHAWGVTRTYGWLCSGCRSWRQTYRQVAACRTCGQLVALDQQGSCRLCRRQRAMVARNSGRRSSQVGLAEANRHGQQLWLIGMLHFQGHGKQPYRKKTIPAGLSLLHPVAHQQLVLFDWPRDLAAGLRHGLPPPTNPDLAAAFHQFVGDHAARYGWSTAKAERVQRAIRILLATQDTPAPPSAAARSRCCRASAIPPRSSPRCWPPPACSTTTAPRRSSAGSGSRSRTCPRRCATSWACGLR